MGLLAPTPANTPHLLNLSDHESFKNNCLASVTPSPVQEQLEISQMVTEILESEKSLISRSLLLDFSEKSEGSDSSSSSVVTHEGGQKSSSMEDDDESVWSIQVNASSRDEDEEEGEYEEGIEEIGEEEEECENDDDGLVDELCEGISRISVNGEKKMPKFSGKHIRFVYNSEDEIEGEEECDAEAEESAEVLPLKGLPTPKGKHFRFPEAADEEDGLEKEEED